VLLIVVGSNGCAKQALNEGTRLQQAEPRASSRSDRLREGPARRSPIAETPTPASSTAPARAQEQAQPQPPAPPSEGAPPPGPADPDPLAVIDWLLKQKR